MAFNGSVVVLCSNDIPTSLFERVPIIGTVIETSGNNRIIVQRARNDIRERIGMQNVHYGVQNILQHTQAPNLLEVEMSILMIACRVEPRVRTAMNILFTRFSTNQCFTIDEFYRILSNEAQNYEVNQLQRLATVLIALSHDRITLPHQQPQHFLAFHEIIPQLRIKYGPDHFVPYNSYEDFTNVLHLRFALLNENLTQIRKRRPRMLSEYIEFAFDRMCKTRTITKRKENPWTQSLFQSALITKTKRERTYVSRNLSKHLQIALGVTRLTGTTIRNFLHTFGFETRFEKNVLQLAGMKLWPDEDEGVVGHFRQIVERFRNAHEGNTPVPNEIEDRDNHLRVIHEQPVYCIDKYHNIMDPDDTFSVDETYNRINVHVSDVDRYLPTGATAPALLDTILRRYSSIYLTPFLTQAEGLDWRVVGFPNAVNANGTLRRERMYSVLPMFPADMTASVLGLNAIYGTQSALTISFTVQGNGQLTDTALSLSRLTQVSRLSYRTAIRALNNQPVPLDAASRQRLRATEVLMRRAYEYRTNNQLDNTLSAEDMVQEMMIATNSITARFCNLNYIPVIYRGNVNEGAVQYTPFPMPHHGLRLPSYCQVTSPIRKSFDLINHINIKSFLRSQHQPNLNNPVNAEYDFNVNRLAQIIANGKQTELWVNQISHRIGHYRTLKRLGSERRPALLTNYVGKLGVPIFCRNASFLPIDKIIPLQDNGHVVYNRHTLIMKISRQSAPKESIWNGLDANYGHNVDYVVQREEEDRNYPFTLVAFKAPGVSDDDYTVVQTRITFSNINPEMNTYRAVAHP